MFHEHCQQSDVDLTYEYKPGDTLALTIVSRTPTGITEHDDEIVLEKVCPGGFFGTALFPCDRDYIIKTSMPSYFRFFLRAQNWEHRPFPPQHSELAAQRTVIASQLIARILPIATRGKCKAPMVYGYSKLPDGFGYVIEKVSGRGPVFTNGNADYMQFKQMQQELTNVAFALGLEHVGQIHPDNPFGLPNIWWSDETNTFIWLDTIPAIPHRKRVWPGIHYRFHDSIKQEFQKEITFDTIHTDRFKAYIADHKDLFTNDEYEDLLSTVSLYEQVLESEQQALCETVDKKPAYVALARAGKKAVTHSKAVKVITDSEYRRTTAQNMGLFITNGEYRIRTVNQVLFRGAIKARERGYIDDTEWDKIEALLGSKTLAALVIYYRSAGALADAVLTASGAYLVVNALKTSINTNGELFDISNFLQQTEHISKEELFATMLLWTFLPPILRVIGIVGTEVLTHTKLNEAKKFASIPLIPFVGYYALLRQYAGDSPISAHYFLRNILVTFSRLSPSGGWGSDLEAKLWAKFGRKIERFLGNK